MNLGELYAAVESYKQHAQKVQHFLRKATKAFNRIIKRNAFGWVNTPAGNKLDR